MRGGKKNRKAILTTLWEVSSGCWGNGLLVSKKRHEKEMRSSSPVMVLSGEDTDQLLWTSCYHQETHLNMEPVYGTWEEHESLILSLCHLLSLKMFYINCFSCVCDKILDPKQNQIPERRVYLGSQFACVGHHGGWIALWWK